MNLVEGQAHLQAIKASSSHYNSALVKGTGAPVSTSRLLLWSTGCLRQQVALTGSDVKVVNREGLDSSIQIHTEPEDSARVGTRGTTWVWVWACKKGHKAMRKEET